MNISQKLEQNKIKIIQESIKNYKNKGRGLSTALKYMTGDIIKMKEDNISLTQQVILLQSVLNVKIKYDTYKKWYRRWINNPTKNHTVSKSSFKSKLTKSRQSSDKSKGINTPKITHNPFADEANLI